MEERRNILRKRALKSAKIVFGDYRYTYDCVIRDVGGGGMRVRCDHMDEVPEDFYLFDQFNGTIQQAAVVWRKGREMGLRLAGEPVQVHTSGDPRLQRFKFL